jgi:alanine-synthesizing transaminase
VSTQRVPLSRRAGWDLASNRAGEALDEEQLCLELLEEGVVVQPGFFCDFERPGFAAVSLVPPPERFASGAAALSARLRAAAG